MADIVEMSISEIKRVTGKEKIPFRSSLTNTLVNYIENHQIPRTLLAKKISQDVTGLRNEARKYYNYATKQALQLIRIRDTAERGYELIHQKDNKTVTQYFISMKTIKNFDVFLKNLVKKTQNFSDKMLIYMGEKPTQMVYSPDVSGKNIQNFSAQNIALYNVSPKDILQIQGKEGQNWAVRLEASKNQLDELVKTSNTVSKFIQTDYYSKEQIYNIRETADQVVSRYNEFKNKTDKIIFTWGPGKKTGTYKWKEFLLTRKISVGNIVEAYARSVVNRTYYLTSIGYINHWNGNTKQYVYQLSMDAFLRSLDENDNVSGILERDTKNFAIKANKAEVMGIKPALEIAHQILLLEEDDEDEIQRIIFEKFDKQHAKGQVENNLQQITDDFIQKLLPY